MTKSVQILLAALLAVAGLVGFQSSAFSAAAPAAVAQAECGDTTGFEQVNLSALPPEAAETVELIKAGGPFPYPEDGQTFGNREGLLPDCADGYYKEYTVETPGSDDRGARRFVVGEAGEFFWTEDHYESFAITNINA
ncbi:ribonuclease domain-containing protein [Saccharopolyspora mangrovi]|uniref:Ribonuclease domain-containing protein n=1 Tax=Saccharopolyspora mangrovi TaxID=3082379 RepID=A0ABU6A5G0_9PSEU|nr:ribonuclease domain-containing protein [Saccharopolyspora sp. S2-29]MEB3366807.1 ribonuclease domain-containing protein [Saccharopolyspora sp. S2-29]